MGIFGKKKIIKKERPRDDLVRDLALLKSVKDITALNNAMKSNLEAMKLFAGIVEKQSVFMADMGMRIVQLALKCKEQDEKINDLERKGWRVK